MVGTTNSPKAKRTTLKSSHFSFISSTNLTCGIYFITDAECILSNTTIPTRTSEGKRVSRDEYFRRLKNEHEDRFSKLIIPPAEPVLSTEDWFFTYTIVIPMV